MKYAELHCVSNFSFLTGASHPEELVRAAITQGYHSLAITDECSLAGVVKAYVEAKKTQFPLIIGSQFHTQEGIHFVALAPNRIAYGKLSSLITKARRRATKGQYLLFLSDVKRMLDDNLIIWFPSLEQCTLLDGKRECKIDNAALYKDLNEFITLTHSRLWIGIENQLQYDDHTLTEQREYIATTYGIPTVACGNVHIHSPLRKPLHDVLTATRLNTSIHQAGIALHSNRERYLRPLTEIQQCYHPQQIDATINIAERCSFCLSELRYEYPKELVPPNYTATQYLKELVHVGANKRWPSGISEQTQHLLTKELSIIHELRYEYYFLTVYDIVQFARSAKILCQGRGSAANSAVCFCLFITEVDPDKSTLLFERFISKERDEPPDIDVDFEHERREEVIQFIYRKYGRQRAALTATVITYRLKSAVRDVAKALDFDQTLIDQLLKSIAWWDQQEHLKQRFNELGIDINNPQIKHFKYLVDEIIGFPRHLSQHVGGFIISSGPLDQLVPIENAAMKDRSIVQWDKDDIEALGLMKIDVLALGMLSAIRKSFHYIEQLRGTRWTLASLPQEDIDTYTLLQQGDSVGIFQVESRAQMAMLPRLKPACFYDLVIEVAIVRPGPIQGNMVHPFLKRRNGIEKVTYPHEEIKHVLERTMGVPIFQEQVIQLAVVAAGFSAGEADQLRRAMASWKKKGELRQYQQKLRDGLLSRGYQVTFAEQIIEQINGFGEYGFPESHAASFALLVYASAWLKCHEPAAFCCGLLNSQPMGFYSPSQLVQDIQRHHITVHPVDVTLSQWDHSLVAPVYNNTPSTHALPQHDIRLGLRMVKGLSTTGAESLLSAREHAPFTCLSDLKQRAHLNRKDLESLARSNALSSLAGHRFQARWEAQGIQPESPLLPNTANQENPLQLAAPSDAQSTMEDYHSTGLTLGTHPMALLRQHPAFKGCKTHKELYDLNHKRFVRIAGLVTGRQRPGSAAGVIFITLEDETGNSNIVVWKDLVARKRAIIVQAKLLKVKGIIEREGSVIHVIAGDVEDLTPLLGDLHTRSRDFH